MTVQITTKSLGILTAYHQIQDDVPGFIITVAGSQQVFVTEEQANKLSDYLKN